MAEPYPPDVRARILTALVERRRRGESFDAIAATPGWPSRRTLRKWLKADPVLAAEVEAASPRQPATRWSRRIARRIAARLAAGEGLRQLCRDPEMPDRRTLAKWMARRRGFSALVWVARFDGGGHACGRKTLFTPELADAIYLRLCYGGALNRVCAARGMPNVRTVREWARRDREFAGHLNLARLINCELRGQALAGDVPALIRQWEADAEAARRGREARGDPDPLLAEAWDPTRA